MELLECQDEAQRVRIFGTQADKVPGSGGGNAGACIRRIRRRAAKNWCNQDAELQAILSIFILSIFIPKVFEVAKQLLEICEVVLQALNSVYQKEPWELSRCATIWVQRRWSLLQGPIGKTAAGIHTCSAGNLFPVESSLILEQIRPAWASCNASTMDKDHIARKRGLNCLEI